MKPKPQALSYMSPFQGPIPNSVSLSWGGGWGGLSKLHKLESPQNLDLSLVWSQYWDSE